MSVPVTAREYVTLIQQSGLVPEERLRQFLAGVKLSTPIETLARQFLEQGLLTRFQLEQLARGHWQGFEFAGYLLLDKIGRGGTGQVFLAESLSDGSRVAIKVLSTNSSNDPVSLTRFAREAQAAAKVSHPNIVRVLHVDITHRPAYLIMEYVEGQTLQAAVARGGTFSGGLAAWCGLQAAQALQAIEANALVHRDIKPANLVLGRQGQLKLLDLGIVRMDCEDGVDLTLTLSANCVLGTADYLAPEQALNSHHVDIRADIYGLGGTLYFLLTGHSPFPMGTSTSKLNRKQVLDPTPLTVLRPDIDLELAKIIHQMLARDRNHRPASAGAVSRALAPLADRDDHFLNRLFDTVSSKVRTNSVEFSHTVSSSEPPSGATPLVVELIEQPPSSQISEDGELTQRVDLQGTKPR